MIPRRTLPTLIVSLIVSSSLLLANLATRPILAQTPPAKDSVDRDYQNELPRIAAKSPAEAMATFTIAPGFRIEQVASEPLVADPVAMAFDEQGRLYVVEMRGYPESSEENLGQIRLLVDADHDGQFDTSTVLVDGLSWPTAIACYGGGVFVGAAPSIYYFKDTNGDGRADVRETVYTGFGRTNVQGLLNTFKWGLDNRIHGAVSSSGAMLLKVGQSEDEAINLRGRDIAFDPRTREIGPTSGGGQHGLSFNRWGEKFVCSNSDHIQQVVFDDRYVARNPYLAAPSARISIAADGPQADVFRDSPIEPWRIVRTRLRRQGIVPGPVERGGKAAGYFTGATGVTIYRGSAWPSKYLDWAVIGDVGSNLIHRKRLTGDGIVYQAQRVDQQSELLVSNDIWFRPVQFANAPDGSLYIADMYREVIEHPASLAPTIKRHLDLTSGRGRGRIYRIVPDDFEQPAWKSLGDFNSQQLVATLAHPNGWHRETAARLLFERQAAGAVGLLQHQAIAGRSPEARIHALWALHSQGALDESIILATIGSKDARVRTHAIRLSEAVAETSLLIRSKLYSLVDDDSLRVRFQLAFTLGELANSRDRNQALANLVLRDGDNRWIQLAVSSSLGSGGSGDVLSAIVADDKYRASAAGRLWIKNLASQIGRQQLGEDVATTLKVLRQLTTADPPSTQLILQSLAASPGSDLERQISAATSGQSAKLLARLLVETKATALNSGAKPAARERAIHLLSLAPARESLETFNGLLQADQSPQVQSAALMALAHYDEPQVAQLVLDHWSELSPTLRKQAAEILFSRPNWLEQILTKFTDEKEFIGNLPFDRLAALKFHPNEEVRRQARNLLNAYNTDRGNAMRQYRVALEMKGDQQRGRVVFKKSCSTCHRLEGVGHEVAPSLAAMKNRGAESILKNVVDPNREINPQFINYLLITNDGRSLSGIISSETATSVTLKRGDGATDTVLRIDIDALRSTGQSLMPVGLEKEITVQGMADLLAYLMSLDFHAASP